VVDMRDDAKVPYVGGHLEAVRTVGFQRHGALVHEEAAIERQLAHGRPNQELQHQ
jgi:hypothetical protein